MESVLPESDVKGKCSEETENAIRLSILLINEGTKTVREVIQKTLKPNNLSDILHQPKIKKRLDSLHNGSNKKLNDDQYNLLYPVKGVADLLKFDLTLLTFLFRNVLQEKPPPSTKSWNRNPDDKDLSVASDIVRLRSIRNTLYGHIVHVSMPNEEFQIKWDILENILLRLGSSKADIDTIKSEVNLTAENTIQSFQRKLTILMENDLENMQAILHHLQISVFRNKDTILAEGSNIKDLIEELSAEVLTCGENLDFKIAKILELLSLIPKDLTNIILQNVNSNSQELLAHVDRLYSLQTEHHNEVASFHEKQQLQMEHIQESSQNMCKSLDTITCQLEARNQKSEQTHTQTILIHEKVLALQTHLSHTMTLDSTSALEINEFLKQKQSTLRILLFNKPEILDEHYDIKEEFCFALGSVPWDFIIDLDHCSRSTGIHDKFGNILSKKKAFIVETYKQLDEISESDKNVIAEGKKALWILANGCEDIGCEPSEKNIGLTVTKIYVLLQSILANMAKASVTRSVCIINLIMSETMKRPIARILQALPDICESLQERIHLEDSCIMSIYFEEKHSHMVPEMDSNIQHLRNYMSPAQFLYVLTLGFPCENMDKNYYYPGDKSLCSLTPEEMNRLQPYIELYHIDIGKIDFENKEQSESDKLIDDIKLEFLKGNEITPEALYLNQNSICHVFVVRKEMASIKTVTEKRLKEKEQHWLKKTNRVYHGYLEIIHDASGSGTTTGLYLLYELREQYPCVQVNKIEENTIRSLSKISKASRKPLLLVVDSSSFQPSDINTFQHRLNNESINSLVVHVRRKVLSDIQSEHSKEISMQKSGSCSILSKLTCEQDKIAFRKLFDSIQQSISADRVYLFGLIAFCEDYTRLKTHIQHCVDQMTQRQIEAVFLVFMVRKFCNSKVQVSLLRNIFDKDSKKANLDDLLGYGSDLLVYDKQQLHVRPAHEALIPQLQEILAKKHIHEVWMTNFMDNLHKICSKSAVSKEDSLSLLHDMFIQRENPKEELFSALIVSLGNCCGKEYVEDQILRFIQVYKGKKSEDHLRGLYARYLMYCMDKPKEAIVQIRMAVKLQTTQSINQDSNQNRTLLTTYGGLFRSYGQLIFKDNLKTKAKFPETALEISLEYFEEAVRAYNLAQKIGTKKNSPTSNLSPSYKYTPHSFLGEAKTRHAFLNIVFHHFCKGKHESLQSFISQSKYSFLQECEKEAMQSLVNLETHFRHDRIHDNEVVVTKQTITELKIKLLLLRYDESTTINKLLKTIDSNAPCDIGMLVKLDAATLKNAFLNRGKKQWSDLGENQLVMIIETILKRIKKNKMAALSCNYEDLILAMIHLRQLKGPDKYRHYNIDLAEHLAKEWVISFPSDYSALFHVGAILLAKGIGENNIDVIKKAIEHFVQCDELCKKHPSAQHLQSIKYALGQENGLCKLIPFYVLTGQTNELQEFFGRRIGRKSVGVRPFKGILKAVLPDYIMKDFNISSDQDPVLKFNLFLRQVVPTLSTLSNVTVASPDECDNEEL